MRQDFLAENEQKSENLSGTKSKLQAKHLLQWLDNQEAKLQGNHLAKLSTKLFSLGSSKSSNQADFLAYQPLKLLGNHVAKLLANNLAKLLAKLQAWPFSQGSRSLVKLQPKHLLLASTHLSS
jgi:hypothetical protein